MSRRTAPVTFLVQSAYIGRVLGFQLVQGIQVDTGRMTEFSPPAGIKTTLRDEPQQRLVYNLPLTMGERLQYYVRVCFMGRTIEPNGFTFTNFLMGYTNNLNSKPNRNYRRDKQTLSSRLKLGQPYGIISGGTMLHSMIGLGPNLSLGINGAQGPLGIRPAMALMNAYGGDGIVEIKGLG